MGSARHARSQAGAGENGGGGVGIADGTADGRNALVSIRGVRKKFGSFKVLKGLDIDFPDNAITTILGPSGTGKSVLLKHIVGILEPDAGQVVVFGKNIWDLERVERLDMRRQLGILFQDGALFGSMNVFDNVAFPLRRHTDMPESEIRELVMERLKEVGLTAAVKKTPSEVSGGMRKRAGFARALIMNPKVVMFDEPDSGLDPVRTSLLNDLILQVHEEHGGAYIVVTHDISSARKLSDYIGLLWKGKLVHHGLAKGALESPDPFVRQFLSGESAGPLGMD
jgi:phospholipid/cholesterol/gamma-HCH transport system ATP-binding protein